MLHERIQKVLSEGGSILPFFFFFFFFFLVDEGRERIQIALKAGPRQPASETPFKLRLAGMPIDGPTLNADM